MGGTPQGSDRHDRIVHGRGKKQQDIMCPVLQSDTHLGMDVNGGTPQIPGQNSRVVHRRGEKARS